MQSDFWLAATERAVKTGAQAALASGILTVVNLWDIDWQQFASVTGIAVIASYLTSIVTGKLGNSEGPSLGPETLTNTGEAQENARNEAGAELQPPGRHAQEE